MRKAITTAAIATAGMLAFAAPASAQYGNNAYPHVRDHSRGTSVLVSRDCQVEFDRRGARVDASRACDGRDLRYATQVMQDHRRYAGQRDRDHDRYDDGRDRDHDRYDRRHDDRYEDGRYDDGRYADHRRYDRGYDDYRHNRRPVAPAQVVGQRDGRAFDMLASGGWSRIGTYSHNRKSMESLWYNRQGNRCVSVYSKKGKVKAVMPAPRQRCVVRY